MANALPHSWLGVEPRHLAALQAVAQHRSFRAAAHALGYSQSTISQLVIQLERMLGLPLVQRHPGSSAELTEHGEVLLTHATSILHSFGAAQADLGALTGQRVRVGMLAALAPRLLTPVLHADTTTPEIVEAEDDAELAKLVADGDVEVAFGELPPRVGPFALRRLGPDPFVLAVPADWAMARLQDRPSYELLERFPLIARTDRAAASRIRGQLLARGIEPVWGAHADSDPAALALARAGSGAAIVPHSTIESWDETIVSIPLGGLIAPRTICWYVHRDRRLPDEIEVITSAARSALNARDDVKRAVAV